MKIVEVLEEIKEWWLNWDENQFFYNQEHLVGSIINGG